MSLFEYARLPFLKYRKEQARNRRFCVLSKQTTSVNGFAKMHCKQTLRRHSKTCLFAIAYGKGERRLKQLLRYVFCYLLATKKISIYPYMDRHPKHHNCLSFFEKSYLSDNRIIVDIFRLKENQPVLFVRHRRAYGLHYFFFR